MLKSKNLTNYYPFEGNANDAVGGNNFTVSGATQSYNKIGSNYNFDGVNDYLYTGTALSMGAWTSLCMRIDFSNPNAAPNYFVWANSTSPDWWIRYTPWTPWSVLFLWPWATSWNYTSLSYDFPASMCHLAIIRTANRNVDWYINWSKIWSSDPWVNTALWIKSIWRRNATNPYYSRCKIDDLCFFNEALSQNNIRRVMLWLRPL